MRVILPILFLLLLSCNNVKMNTSDYDKLKEREGVFYSLGKSTPHTGKASSYHSNGKVKIEANFIDGMLHSFFREFDKDGYLQYETFFDLNNRISTKTFYPKNNKPKKEEFFWQKEMVFANEYYESGASKNEIFYKDSAIICWKQSAEDKRLSSMCFLQDNLPFVAKSIKKRDTSDPLSTNDTTIFTEYDTKHFAKQQLQVEYINDWRNPTITDYAVNESENDSTYISSDSLILTNNVWRAKNTKKPYTGYVLSKKGEVAMYLIDGQQHGLTTDIVVHPNSTETPCLQYYINNEVRYRRAYTYQKEQQPILETFLDDSTTFYVRHFNEEDGSLLYDGFVSNGEVLYTTAYQPNGETKHITINDYRNQDFYFKHHYDNGKLQRIEFYQNENKRNVKTYFKNEKLESDVFLTYANSGNIWEIYAKVYSEKTENPDIEFNYDFSNSHSEIKAYYENGQPKLIALFKGHEATHITMYTKDGKVIHETEVGKSNLNDADNEVIKSTSNLYLTVVKQVFDQISSYDINTDKK